MLRVFIDGHTAAATKPKSSSDSFIFRLIEIALKFRSPLVGLI